MTDSRVYLSPDAVLDRLEKAIEAEGGVRATAKAWGFSPSYICDMRLGRRKLPKHILTRLGVTSWTVYAEAGPVDAHRCERCRRLNDLCRC